MTEQGIHNYAFLFTDIEGSTRLAQQFPDTIASALEFHNSIMRETLAAHNGMIFEFVGDGYCVAFENINDAVEAAVEIQKKLGSHKWKDAVIKVRMGIHYGQAHKIGEKFSGYMTMARTQRVMSAAYGEQILISSAVHNGYSARDEFKIGFRDLGERRLKDLIQPLKVYQITSEGLRSEFPPLKTLDARPNNLPIQLTTFIGRESEIKEIKELMSGTHLLTLLGAGGSGKTRVALQVAADIIDHYNHGVWFVELEQLSDEELLPQTINLALKIQEESQKAPEETLCEYLKDKETLLIMDNCEHIADECARLIEKMLRSSPGLRIIVTSRESLKCEGEQTHRLSSLQTPSKGKKYNFEDVLNFESVKLFAERAQSVNPSFEVTEENASVVAAICSDLDGIPLAIELAAARIKVLNVEKIYERLSDRFKLLTGGKRTALPRQQTLKALIDWSYDLLNEHEKKLWQRLSIFSGGWNLEAAEEVCGDDELDTYEIMDLLINLTEKSITIYDSERDRYRMLESIRQYGEDLLRDKSEIDNMGEKHVKYFADLAKKSEKEIAGVDVKKWLEILETENGNMEAALHRSEEGKYINEGAKLIGSLANYWVNRGYLTTGRFWLDGYLEKRDMLEPELRGNLLGIAGIFSNMLGDSDKAEKLIEESLKISRELGSKDDIASGLNNLASVVYEKGDYTKARQLIEETLEIDREMGDDTKISFSLINLGTVARLQGDFDSAKQLLEESLEIRRKAKNKFAIASSLFTLAILHINLVEFDIARKYVNEGLEISRELGNNFGIGDGLSFLGMIESYLGNYEEALRLLNESLKIFEEMTKKNKIADTRCNIGIIYYQTGDFDKALDCFDNALDIQEIIGDKYGIALSKLSKAKTKLILGELDAAMEILEESLAMREKMGYTGGIGDCTNVKAKILMEKSRLDEADELFRKSLELHLQLKMLPGVASDILGLARVEIGKGNASNASKLLNLSENVLRISGTAPDIFDRKIAGYIREILEQDAKGKETEITDITDDLRKLLTNKSDTISLLQFADI